MERRDVCVCTDNFGNVQQWSSIIDTLGARERERERDKSKSTERVVPTTILLCSVQQQVYTSTLFPSLPPTYPPYYRLLAFSLLLFGLNAFPGLRCRVSYWMLSYTRWDTLTHTHTIGSIIYTALVS